MLDVTCSIMRDVVFDALIEETCNEDSALTKIVHDDGGMNVVMTDSGLAVQIGENLYGIVIQKV